MSYRNRNKVERLLNSLCTNLGFCLSAAEYAHIQAMLPLTIDAFVDQIFLSEGMEVQMNTSLRQRIRECIVTQFEEQVASEEGKPKLKSQQFGIS